MKTAFLTGIIIIILFAASLAHAGGRCPQRADRLEDFANCMVPMRGEVGTVYRGTLADMSGDAHSNLMRVMHNAPVVPPHTMPSSYTPVPFGMWNSMMAVAASHAYKNDPHSPIWGMGYAGSLYYPSNYRYPW